MNTAEFNAMYIAEARGISCNTPVVMRSGGRGIQVSHLYSLYLIMFVASVFWSDFVNLIICSMGPFNLYPIDLLAFLTFVFALRNRAAFSRQYDHSYIYSYVLFLVWLLISVFRGIPSYGFSAIGDSRLIVPFFFFVVSYATFVLASDFRGIVLEHERLLYVSTAGVILLFSVEVFIGHRFGFSFSQGADFGYLEDFRGVRVLGSNDTLIASIMIIFIVMGKLYKGKLSLARVCFLLVLVAIVIRSQNRTAIVSALSALVLYVGVVDLRKKVRLILMIVCGIALGLIFVIVLANSTLRVDFLATMTGAVDEVINVHGTGGWRVLAAESVLEDIKTSPVFGSGFGGYWLIQMFDETIVVAPHNQYLTLLSKTGCVGLVLFLLLLFYVLRSYFRYRKSIPRHARPLFETVFIALMAVVPYGFGYDFYPLFGFYLGVFYGIIHLAARTQGCSGSAHLGNYKTCVK